MKYLRFSFVKELTCAVLLAMSIGGCTTPPAPPKMTTTAPKEASALPRPTPAIALERKHVELGGGVHVDYRIKRTISAFNGVSCYAFITGTLNNDSNQILSRRTALDFNFFSAGEQSFRDLTYPVTNVPPGSRAQFEMVVSPVHEEGCVNYDRIEVSLRKVLTN